MTTQNFPNCTDPTASPFAWALQSSTKNILQTISDIDYIMNTQPTAIIKEWEIQLAAFVAWGED